MRRPGYLGDLSDTWFGYHDKSSYSPMPSAPAPNSPLAKAHARIARAKAKAKAHAAKAKAPARQGPPRRPPPGKPKAPKPPNASASPQSPQSIPPYVELGRTRSRQRFNKNRGEVTGLKAAIADLQKRYPNPTLDAASRRAAGSVVRKQRKIELLESRFPAIKEDFLKWKNWKPA